MLPIIDIHNAFKIEWGNPSLLLQLCNMSLHLNPRVSVNNDTARKN